MIVRWDTQDMGLTATVGTASSRAVAGSAKKPRPRRGWGGAPEAPGPAVSHSTTHRRPVHQAAAPTDQTIRTGVPTGISRASLRICGLGTRMQPCDGRPGMSRGSFVPWMPMTPPPGQSLRRE